MSKKTFALCGLSTRAIYHFALPLLGAGGPGTNDFSGTCKLAGILDLDTRRAAEFLARIGKRIPVYSAGEIGRMARETGAETVLVATPDYLHAENIVDALEAGCDVIVEKPMVISLDEVQRVREAEKRTGRSVIVAFNYRYSPQSQAIKRLILEGRIGRVTNIEFTYNLDTFHGSSYFYRWNRERAKSGGLNIHKCCHHFDLINWMLDDVPEEVFAFGKLNYFGPEGALRPRGQGGNALDRVSERKQCPVFQTHYAAKADPSTTAVSTGWDAFDLPYDVQYPPQEARYIYDAVIDIEDTYSVVARYRGGASLAYSCNFCTPWEGYLLGINGTEGRIEAEQRTNPDPTGLSVSRERHKRLFITPLFGRREEIEIPEMAGAHDGADPLLQRDLFEGVSEHSRRFGLVAGSREGGLAVAMGEAVWLSIRDRQPVDIEPFPRRHASAIRPSPRPVHTSLPEWLRAAGCSSAARGRLT